MHNMSQEVMGQAQHGTRGKGSCTTCHKRQNMAQEVMARVMHNTSQEVMGHAQHGTRGKGEAQHVTRGNGSCTTRHKR